MKHLGLAHNVFNRVNQSNQYSSQVSTHIWYIGQSTRNSYPSHFWYSTTWSK